MRRLRLRWYVFGAHAAAAYGRPRMTADVDVTVDPRGKSTTALVDALAGAGFELRFPLGEDFLRETGLLPLVHRSTTMPVDLVLARSSLHQELLARRKMIDLVGVRVPIISPEDLIVTKVLAGRAKDFDDLRGVLREQQSLDMERIRELLRELEEALGEPGLVRRFERLRREVQRA